MDEEERADVKDCVIALLGDQYVDAEIGRVRNKLPNPEFESITLAEIRTRTTAKGYWVIQRDERPPEDLSYFTFLSGSHHGDEDIVLKRCPPVRIDGHGEGCTYASDWICDIGASLKYLAFGPEETLS